MGVCLCKPKRRFRAGVRKFAYRFLDNKLLANKFSNLEIFDGVYCSEVTFWLSSCGFIRLS